MSYRLIALLVACSSIFAANSNLKTNRLYHRSWTFKDGAPQNAYIIRQTADGFLWIGTATGPYRFDGVRFDRFEPSSGSLLRPDAFTLQPTPDGGLWVTHSYGGASFVAGR